MAGCCRQDSEACVSLVWQDAACRAGERTEWQDVQDAACMAGERTEWQDMQDAACMAGERTEWQDVQDAACMAGERTSDRICRMLHAGQGSVRVAGYAGCCMQGKGAYEWQVFMRHGRCGTSRCGYIS